MTRSKIILLLALYLFSIENKAQTIKHGNVVTEHLVSTILKENKIGIDVNRTVKIYLPPGYESSHKSYPVVYLFHNMWGSASQVFENSQMINLMERGFANNVVKEFILVAADYSSPTIGSLYENSPVSGRWIDFTMNELVPFVDGKFRTIKNRDSRAVMGQFMGGRGALKMAMSHAETFGVAYALHPVATGNGYLPWSIFPMDWKKTFAAKTFDDVGSKIFVAVCQAYLPNINRPPFYCDFFMEPDADGNPKIIPDNIQKAKSGFLLEESLIESASNLRKMRGLALDWGRFDTNQDHVYANQTFSRKLNDLDITHEAEEYNGDPWNLVWTDNGRFYSRVLPFFSSHLIFE
jgi:hypothetical protein